MARNVSEPAEFAFVQLNWQGPDINTYSHMHMTNVTPDCARRDKLSSAWKRIFRARENL
jgi:hypothetical protein